MYLLLLLSYLCLLPDHAVSEYALCNICVLCAIAENCCMAICKGHAADAGYAAQYQAIARLA